MLNCQPILRESRQKVVQRVRESRQKVVTESSRVDAGQTEQL